MSNKKKHKKPVYNSFFTGFVLLLDLIFLLPLWVHDFLFQVLYLSAEYLEYMKLVNDYGWNIGKLLVTPAKTTLVSTKENGERYLFNVRIL